MHAEKRKGKGMNIHYDFENFGSIRKPVVTTGSFDGVHLGHHVIIKRINQIAKDIGGESVLITFFPHPRKVLYPNAEGKDLLMINSQREKIDLLSKTGLDHLFIIRFTLDFSKLTGVDFIRKILVEKLHVAKVVIGFNHHFGHNREGNFDYLYELGKFYNFEVEEIPMQDVQNETVSSTKIRKALVEGNIMRANAYLDHLYFIIGKLQQGNPEFKQLGFESYNLPIEESEKLIPPFGTYAVNVIENSNYHRAMAIVFPVAGDVGTKIFPRIDIHLLEPADLTGKDVYITFHKKIREFDDSMSAINQTLLSEDKEYVDELIF